MSQFHTLITSRNFRLAGMIVISAVLTLLLFFGNFLDSWQEKILDRFFLAKPPPDKIIIIGIDEQSIAAIGQWPWPRVVFTQLLDNIANASAIGLDINFSEPSRIGNRDDEALANAFARTPNRVTLPFVLSDRTMIDTRPISLFQKNTRSGFVNITLDYDGVARHLSTQINGYSSFSRILLDNTKSVPDRFRIDYAGPEKTFLTLPASEVINKTIPNHIFQDAIVLIGATAPSLHDTVLTPFGSMPGVELHANSIATMRSGIFFAERPLFLTIALIIAIHLLICLSLFFTRRFLVLIILLFGIFSFIFLLSFLLFSFHVVPPIAYLIVGYGIAVFSSVAYQYIAESKEKRFIRNSFQYYLTPDVIDELLKNPEKLTLGGEQKDITVFFSDIRSFTTISEGLTPTQLTRLLNEYLTAMTDIVMDHRGVVDKYIGDAVMAFWGAPLANPDQARDACESAIQMIHTLNRLNEKWQEEKFPPIHIGMGINRGDLVVGNMGSQKRFNYTLMGDEVNFASRLEGLTKYYHVQCLISESVKESIKSYPHLITRALDEVIVKGKKEPKKIFELLIYPLDDKTKKALEFFAQGRKHYCAGEWDKATIAFRQAIALNNDGPSQTFLERVRELKQNPPDNWNGIYEFTSK